MLIYVDNALNEKIEESLKDITKERYIIRDIENYIQSNIKRVCCLYGLRRTGKTIMMLQVIKKLGVNNCLFLECQGDSNSSDDMSMICKQINEHSSKKYIFIDEITKTKDFIRASSVLSNHYVSIGKKIILAGTDSFGFWLTRKEELYDRDVLIHTTYISFQEHKFILNKNILDYILYGGTLTDGSVFYNKDNVANYTNTAIAYNITNSLKKAHNRKCSDIQPLVSLALNNELPSIINKVIEFDSREFLLKIIEKTFEFHDLGSLEDLLTKHNKSFDIDDESDNLLTMIRNYLGIKENLFSQIDDEIVSDIIKYLIDLDVLFKVPENPLRKFKTEYIFVQPGMRFCQADALFKALSNTNKFRSINASERLYIQKLIRHDIAGGILENIIFFQTIKSLPNCDMDSLNNITVCKYNNVLNAEIDILVMDLVNNCTVAIEVKLSDKRNKEQFKHLINDSLCEEIEAKSGTKIIKKIVMYRGDSTTSEENPEIEYLNVEEYLCNIPMYLVKWFGTNILKNSNEFTSLF